MEAPEKIYLVQLPNGRFDREWFVNTIHSEDIEYTRTDAFIEKAARFLEYKLNDRVEIRVSGTLIPSLTDKKTFVEDFKNYMKGE